MDETYEKRGCEVSRPYYVYACMYVCMYVCMHVCMCMSIIYVRIDEYNIQ